MLWAEKEPRLEVAANNADTESVPRSASDESLLIALRDRDQEALEELFRRYARLVMSIGMRILRDAGEAEEIVQETYLFLYQKAELFDAQKGGAKAWLVQVAYHRALNRQEYLHRRNFYFGTNVAFLADTLVGQEDMDRDLASKLNRERLKEAFQSLTERQRLTLELFFFEQLDFREIAELLGESPENIRHHYYRGLQKLRKIAVVRKLNDKNRP